MKKTLTNWLNNKYLLIIRNDENFAEKTTITFTYAKLILFFFSILLVLMLLSLYLSRTLMAQWFDPRHENFIMTRQLITLTSKIDSLQNMSRIKEERRQLLNKILIGDTEGMDFQETEVGRQVSLDKNQLTPLPAIDSQFRKQFEEGGDVSYLAARSNLSKEIDQIYFFTPIEGIITRGYKPQIEHYGVDVVSKSNEPVKCIADGTVIFASWTMDAGNVIAVQHRGSMISVYKHNSALMKKVGNFVNGGEVISIIGNTGEITTGPHLHFELWYNGNPVDPEEFISF
ncbi:MAG: M23 family metallopeptidase [Cyclobacteriaceae bacterium]